MRTFILLALIAFPSTLSAQELHKFSNGEVADAEKINENFTYVLENAGGGCSATQQDNTVLIECADGTSGVLAGAGTVVQVGEGVIGEAPPINFDTGPIVCIDGDDTIVGEVSAIFSGCDVKLGGYESVRLVNDEDTQSILFGTRFNRTVNYTEPDCEGAPLAQNSTDIYTIDGELYVTTGSVFDSIFGKSYRRGARLTDEGAVEDIYSCVNRDAVLERYRQLAPFTLPEVIRNALYPVRVEQLP